VGVNVAVGEIVGDGEAVAVSVGRKVGEAVAGSVGEGSGLIVHVGSGTRVGIGWAIAVKPLQPTENRMKKIIRAKFFFK